MILKQIQGDPFAVIDWYEFAGSTPLINVLQYVSTTEVQAIAKPIYSIVRLSGVCSRMVSKCFRNLFSPNGILLQLLCLFLVYVNVC